MRLHLPQGLTTLGQQPETRRLKVKIDPRAFAGFQIISRKGWLAIEVAPHTNTRCYFKRVSPREGPSDLPDQASPPARIFPKPSRRARQSWPRPAPIKSTRAPFHSETHSAPSPGSVAGAGETLRGRPPSVASILNARKRKAPLRTSDGQGRGCETLGQRAAQAPAPPEPDSRGRRAHGPLPLARRAGRLTFV